MPTLHAEEKRSVAGQDPSKKFLILGTGRSGTSLLAGLLNKAGFYSGDDLFQPREANPLGFFENAEINGLNEAIQRLALGKSRKGISFGDGQGWLIAPPLGVECAVPQDVRDQIVALLGNRSHVALKDPRFCFTAPVWMSQIPAAELLCVFRHPQAVIRSMRKELVDAPYLHDLRISTRDLFALWRLSYLRVIGYWAEGIPTHFFSYESLLEEAGLCRLEDLAGCRIARDFSTRSLNRSPSGGMLHPYADMLLQLMRRLESGLGGKLQSPSLAQALAVMEKEYQDWLRVPPVPAISKAQSLLDEARNVLWREKSPLNAIDLLLEVSETRPLWPQAHLLLGQALIDAGELAAALPRLEYAALAMDRNPWAPLALARLYRQVGFPSHADQCLKRAHELAPDNPQVRALLSSSPCRPGELQSTSHQGK